MKRNLLLLISLLILFNNSVLAQANFTYTPQHPKAGDIITFTYLPTEELLKAKTPIEGSVFYFSADPGNYYFQNSDDINFQMKGKKLTGTIKTDTSQNFLFIGFSTAIDNKGEGFYILLNDGNKIKRGAYNSMSKAYQFMNDRYGIVTDWKIVSEALETEISLHPEDKKQYIGDYVRILSKTKEKEFPELVQKEIEWLLKAGLTAEADYTELENMYHLAGLPEQAKLMNAVKKEKFPQGKWLAEEILKKFQEEKDPVKVLALTPGVIHLIETHSGLSYSKPFKGIYQAQVLNAYIANEDWEGLKMFLQQNDLEKILQSFYAVASLNDALNKMQETNNHLEFAADLAKILLERGRQELKALTDRQMHYSPKQWVRMRQFHYAYIQKNYAMVLYRMGRYKEGLKYAKEAMDVNLKNHDGNVTFITTTYALLAEKVFPAKEYLPTLESLVKEGKYNQEIVEVLKRAYIKSKGKEKGVEQYLADLQKSKSDELLEKLQKTMVNRAAPDFVLTDLRGNKVQLSNLKGKTVVLDFWATWCGPCVASLPAMQKAVNHYKNDSNVLFLFIDVAEKGINRRKTVEEFIQKYNYDLTVLVDEDDAVMKQYVKDEGIPAKFIIDKNGKIRFITRSFDGNDIKLVEELKAMIETASKVSKNE